jgi:hypothetical protein
VYLLNDIHKSISHSINGVGEKGGEMRNMQFTSASYLWFTGVA